MLTPLVCVATLALAADPSPPSGFTPLFNGKDLTGWYGWAIHSAGGTPPDLRKAWPNEVKAKVDNWTDDAKKHWSVENGELVNDGHGAYLVSERAFGDYELLIEYKTVARADSGIYLKSVPQVQIWDYTDPAKFSLGADKGSGGLWNNAKGDPGKDPLVKADKPFGEWNKFRIIQVGERTTIYLNDQLVVNHARLANYYEPTRPLPQRGPIVLQTHGGEIRWRNIAVRELSSSEANKRLLEADAKQYTAAFNGTDLSGWDGAAADYEVKDGAIVCKPGKGGNLFTTKQYADFAVRVEYKLPPGGNNGLLIRYPGGEKKADGAYAGMCEVQILDETNKKYAKLDPRQMNGSVYAMIPSVPGYLRPVGDWNVMEVTVNGPKIMVELNGTRILDGDVSQVKEFMGGRPHPGRENKDGHFGFAGHTDPVMFRTVAIKELK